MYWQNTQHVSCKAVINSVMFILLKDHVSFWYLVSLIGGGESSCFAQPNIYSLFYSFT